MLILSIYLTFDIFLSVLHMVQHQIAKIIADKLLTTQNTHYRKFAKLCYATLNTYECVLLVIGPRACCYCVSQSKITGEHRDRKDTKCGKNTYENKQKEKIQENFKNFQQL